MTTRLLIVAGLLACSKGCSLVSMQPTPELDYVIGRTMELGQSPEFIDWNVTRFPRGMELGREPTIANKLMCNNSMTWKVKYAFVGLASGGASLGFVADGMNEEGLSISSLTLRVSKYPPIRPSLNKPAICYPMILPWLLSTAATVEDVKKQLKKVKVTPALDWVTSLDFMNFHWEMSDATGAHWILEYVNGIAKWYKDELGVLTNDPPYPWHVDNLNNYVGVSTTLPDPSNIEVQTDSGPVPALGSFGTNLLGMPGDLSPPSRFVRMFYLRQFVLASPLMAPSTLNETYTTLTALLNSIFIVKGTVAKTAENSHPEMTHWAVLKNPAKRHLYLRSYGDMQWKLIDISKMNTSEWRSEVVETGFSGVKDIT